MSPYTRRCRSALWCRWLIGILLLGAGSILPVSAQVPQVVDGIAAVVNEGMITIGEVFEAMAFEVEQLRQQSNSRVLPEQLKELYRRTLTNLIHLRLQLERARKLNLQVNDDDVAYHIDTLKQQNQVSSEQLGQILQTRGLTLEAYRAQVREGLLVAKVVNAEVRSRLVVMDTELQQAYEQRRDRYRVPSELTVSHILFLPPPNASEADLERLRQKAAMVLQQLRNGADFATLARQYSEGPSAQQGGLLGTFRAGELLPGFEEAAAALKPGEISNLVQTRAGWHIIRVESRKEGMVRSFEEAREEIKADLLQTKTEQKYQEWLETLRQSAYIKILYEG
jgi:parvulin-like peptidyl-prolyl isomerase